jgi:hypothetical protein
MREGVQAPSLITTTTPKSNLNLSATPAKGIILQNEDQQTVSVWRHLLAIAKCFIIVPVTMALARRRVRAASRTPNSTSS